MKELKELVKYLTDKIDANHVFILIDVGSKGGISSKWDILTPYSRNIGFEPNEEEFNKLKQTKESVYFPYALFSESKDLILSLTRSREGSSVLALNQSFFLQYQKEDDLDSKIEGTIKIPREKVKVLDDILSEEKINDIDFIKLNVEGADLDVMQGACSAITSCFGMQVEVSFREMRLGQPLFGDVDRFLRERGFVLMDMRRNYWKRVNRFKLGKYKGKGEIIFAAALYFKDIGYFFSNLKTQKDDKKFIVSKILKSILTCLVYGYFDFAEYIASIALERKYLGQDEYDPFLYKLKKVIKRKCFIDFPGRFLLFKIADKISRTLRAETNMIDCDNMIGNVLDK